MTAKCIAIIIYTSLIFVSDQVISSTLFNFAMLISKIIFPQEYQKSKVKKKKKEKKKKHKKEKKKKKHSSKKKDASSSSDSDSDSGDVGFIIWSSTCYSLFFYKLFEIK